MSIEGIGGVEVSETSSNTESPKTNETSPELDKINDSELKDVNKPVNGSDVSPKPSSETHPENERLPDESNNKTEQFSEPTNQNYEIPDEKSRLPENSNEKPPLEANSDHKIHNEKNELPDSDKLPDTKNKNDSTVGNESENNKLPNENEPLDDNTKVIEPKGTEQSKGGEPYKIDTQDNGLEDKYQPKENDPKNESSHESEHMNQPKVDDATEDNKETVQPKTNDQSDDNEKNNISDKIEPSNEDTDQPVKRIPTKNEKLEGSQHPETGVPFDAKNVKNSEGDPIEAVVPEFESTYDTQLPEGSYRANDKSQFDYCNSQLNDAAFNQESENYDPELAGKFTPEQQEDIKDRKTPEGYTWHHDAEPGKMQLVDSDTHADTGHTGGRTIWGGGNEYR